MFQVNIPETRMEKELLQHAIDGEIAFKTRKFENETQALYRLFGMAIVILGIVASSIITLISKDMAMMIDKVLYAAGVITGLLALFALNPMYHKEELCRQVTFLNKVNLMVALGKKNISLDETINLDDEDFFEKLSKSVHPVKFFQIKHNVFQFWTMVLMSVVYVILGFFSLI